MHELSIVMGIVDIAQKEAEKANIDSFNIIELEIGKLSGISMEALDFAWQSAVLGTVLENAERKIILIEAVAKCVDCDSEFISDTLYECCPDCGSFFTNLLKGNELKVKSLEYNSSVLT